jgi:hypothetical protein
MTTIALPCPPSGLPTKADLTNMFNQITAIPSDIQAQIEELKTQAQTDTRETLERIQNLENEMKEKVGEERARVQAQIDALENGEDPFGIISELEDTIKDIEETIETISDLFTPWWDKGKVRQLEKEAEDAFTELVQEFHIYIPVKMMEMISKIVPVSFSVPVLGLTIDALRIMEPEYQEELKQQIAGITEEYTTKLETLQQDFESGKLQEDAYNSAMDELEDQRSQIIDAVYALVPEQYRYFDGEFGVECAEWKAKLTWSYIKNEIMEWCTMSLFKLLDKLIGMFKEIWDALGLPDLPIPLSFDMAAWVRAVIDQVVAKYQEEMDRITGDIEKLQNFDVEQEIADLEQDAKDKATEIEDKINNFDAQKELEDQLAKLQGDIVSQIMELSIPLPSPFDISIQDIMGGEIEGKVQCLEDKINQICTAARDWKIITMKELFNIWLKKIKKFLDAIGLGKLLDFLTLTFCDVLELIGLPLEIPLPGLDKLSALGVLPPVLTGDILASHDRPQVTLPSLSDDDIPDFDNMTEEEYQEFLEGLV